MKKILLAGLLFGCFSTILLFSTSRPLDGGLKSEKTATVNQPIEKPKISDEQKLKMFTTLIYSRSKQTRYKLLGEIEKIWEPEFIPLLIEFIRLDADREFVWDVAELLAKKTDQKFGNDFISWLEWLWESDPVYAGYYSNFKGTYYQHIDQKFDKYFKNRHQTSKIRLDEIVWGGVKQDGIPPLRNPSLLDAQAAEYLSNQDVVFGFYLNGEAKAYPKRILAWHEFFTDTFGDQKIAGVYCTLCGTVIAYDMVHNGTFHDLGTSGFLYRSNKLMYDKATQSLWNTIEGKPVMGPLADKGIELATYPVVTTTWGEWKKRHPDTKVLGIPTEHVRDYSEGAAYANYFATDELMFPVPILDKRLANKAEVLIIRANNYRKDPLAISISYLQRKKWYQEKIDATNFVVLSEKSGARAFDAKNVQFEKYKKGKLIDVDGHSWQIQGDELVSDHNQRLKQLASHNIFWFAWYNSYPKTRLVYR